MASYSSSTKSSNSNRSRALSKLRKSLSLNLMSTSTNGFLEQLKYGVRPSMKSSLSTQQYVSSAKSQTSHCAHGSQPTSKPASEKLNTALLMAGRTRRCTWAGKSSTKYGLDVDGRHCRGNCLQWSSRNQSTRIKHTRQRKRAGKQLDGLDGLLAVPSRTLGSIDRADDVSNRHPCRFTHSNRG